MVGRGEWGEVTADNWAAPFVLIFFKCFPQSPCKIYCSLTIVKSARRFSSFRKVRITPKFRPKNNRRRKKNSTLKNLESTVKIRQVFHFVHACPQESSQILSNSLSFAVDMRVRNRNPKCSAYPFIFILEKIAN